MIAGRGALLLALACVGATGCASYEERMRSARRAYYDGDVERAVELLEQAAESPGVDRYVASLELGSALLTAGRYARSTWEFEQADNRLEVLDYTSVPLEDLSAFVLGGEMKDYRASPPERVLVNTLNMLAFLGLGDPEEAAVEARRLRILLDRTDVPEGELYANDFAWGLAALTFEVAGDRAEATDAWRVVPDSPLADRTLAAGALAEGERPGTVLVVVQRGKVPVRREAIYLFPVGGGLHTLHVPTLVPRASAFTGAEVTVDGEALGEVPALFDLGAHTRQRFEREFTRLLAAAVIQAVPRTVLTESLREQAVEQADEEDAPAVEALAWVASFLLDLGLASLTPTDTRSWSLLPEVFHARRLELPPGEHRVVVGLRGVRTEDLAFDVTVEPGRLALVHVATGPYEGWRPLPAARRRNLEGRPEVEQALEILEAAAWWREHIRP